MDTPLAGWENFFVAQLGAAAALAGLLFVSLSINLTRILAFRHLTMRAAEALVSLFSVVFVCSAGLVPGQPLPVFGAEVLVIGSVTWLIQLRTLFRSFHATIGYQRLVHVLTNQAPPLPFIVSGALLMSGDAGGAYWIVPGALLSIAAGALDAWVLLVEIQR